jgi:hypothetical protein
MEHLALKKPSHINVYNDPMIPFYAYLEQADTSKRLALKFHYYSQLPQELRLLIPKFSDPQTLFWFMQTCSSARAEAKTVFWSLETTWYYVAAKWISDRNGITSSDAQCQNFASLIKQVEIEYHCGRLGQ